MGDTLAKRVASLFATLSLDDSDYKQGLNSARSGLQGLGSSISNVGSRLQTVGASMTAFTAPITAGLVYAVNESRTFSRTMSNINAILGITGTEAEALRTTLLNYGGDTVAGPQAVAEAYYEIVSGVADVTTHMAILDAAVATSEAGQADLTATTAALISIMNSYRFPAEDAAFASDVLSRTVGMGVGSMDEFGSAIGRTAGLAAQFGIGFDELGGSMAYLTAQGYSASQAGTLVENMITTLLNPTENLREAIAALGYDSGAALLEAEGLAGAYQLLSEQNGGLDGLITNTTALQGAVALTNEGFDGFLTTFIGGIEGATAAAREIQNETATWELFRSKLDELAILVGDQLAPVLVDLMDDKIIPLINTTLDWIAANPQLFGTIVMITGAVTLLGPIIFALGTAITIVSTAVGVLTFALSPLGVALIAGGLLVLAYKNNWLGFKDFIDGTVRPTIERLINDIRTLNSLVGNPLNLESNITVAPRGHGTYEGGGFYASAGPSAATGFVPAGSGTHAGGGAWAGGPIPGRAGGGNVAAGSPYVVGEEGPELFVPGMSGGILPAGLTAGLMGGGGGMINVYQQPGESGEALARRIVELQRMNG